MKFYAKTYYEGGQKKGETLQEHTENLLSGLDKFKKLYRREIDKISLEETFWEDLKVACLLHDVGKISTPFQNKIRRALRLPELEGKPEDKEIYHNYISPAFLIGVEELGEEENERRFFNLLFAIAFHHDRPFSFDREALEKTLNTDISHFYDDIIDWIKSNYSNYKKKDLKAFYYEYLKQYLDGSNNLTNDLKYSQNYILLKGLLHRLDYSASAYLPVETERLGETTPRIIEYLNKKYQTNRLRPFQKEAKNYRDTSVILNASTGMGKTEFAVNWLGDSKGFYTLPLKVSANAMFGRLDKMFPGNKVGLLHSDSYSLALQNEEFSIEDNIQRINVSRQLSLPLIVTTADQLFTSVFKWSGYERIYATLMYSKIILDEPQSYSPKTLAMIIKALEEIANLGGKFCYMSATNHPFITKRLEEVGTKLEPVYNQEQKHKMEVLDKPLEGLKNKILDAYDSKNRNKILVITNTVKQSQELLKALKKKSVNVKLLHSGFIKKHRNKKENDIQKDFRRRIPVIWISTQIVEASLDIDYDVLFTEVATLDALIQRMGRIYRGSGRVIKQNDPSNIIIAVSNPSDKGYIYNKEIVHRTKHALEKYSGKVITEEIKQELMNRVYDEDEIVGTEFYREFQNAYQLLKLGFETDSKSEAQKLFRDIAQVSAIPVSIYEKNDTKINFLVKQLKSKRLKLIDRIKINNELTKFMLSIPAWRSDDSSELFKQKSASVFLVPAKYDEDIGLKYDKIDNIF